MSRGADAQPAVTLRIGASLLRRGAVLGFFLGLTLALVSVLAATLIPMLPDTEPGEFSRAMEQALEHLLDEQPGFSAMLWLLAVAVPAAVVLWIGQRRASLRVTATGLEGHLSAWLGHGLSGQTTGDWSVAWSEIRSLRLEWPEPTLPPVQRLGRARLVIESARGEVRVAPFLWFDPAGSDHRLSLGEAARARSLDPQALMARAPLLQQLRARGLAVDSAPGAGAQRPAGFDLASHRGMVVQLAALLAGGLYALVDTFFLGHYRALESLPAAPFAAVAGSATLAVLLLGRGAPRLERLVVGALTVVALSAAVHPALLRFNALTATPRTVSYVATAPGRFEAAGEDLPALDLSGEDIDAYWEQYPAGAGHPFTVLRGAGRFWQLDLAPLYARTRDFYRDRDEAAAPAPGR